MPAKAKPKKTAPPVGVLVRFPPALLHKIDAARGETGRPRWIVQTVAAAVGAPELAAELRGTGRPRKIQPTTKGGAR
jgi:hypothetical protein